MFYAIAWFFVIALLSLWSLAAWALHAMAAWSLSSAGAWSGAASGAGALSLPSWLAPWVPPEVTRVLEQAMTGIGPVIESLLQAAPALAGGLTVAAWVVWGIGSALLLLLGASLHLLIALWRRGSGGGIGPSGGPSLASR